ncbi:hypothetical protein Tco_0375793 [Tanacetum coccineum]
MTTLAEHIIVAEAENRPPMLEKSMYDSWASRIRLFIKGKKHGRMMVDSIDNGSFVYPTIEENGQTRPIKYSELTEAQQLQDECDVQATNIILYSLPLDVVKHFNTKFLNALLSEWSKFVTDVKLAKSLYTTNYDQLYTYLNQHKRHAKEVCIMRERYPNPLAFVANSPTLYNPSQSPYHSAREDPIECINKAMEFLSAVASRFSPSNNQLETLSNARNQATIQDGRVTVQQVQGRQTQSYVGTGNRGIASTLKGNYASGQPREKLLLSEAREAGQILDEEQLAFLADLRISETLVAQQKIPQNLAFQTIDLDAYDSNCDDLSLAKAVLIENLSRCNPEVLSEVPYFDSYPNDIINQDV